MRDNIERFEAQYGEIKLVGMSNENAFGFQLPVKPANEKVN